MLIALEHVECLLAARSDSQGDEAETFAKDANTF